MTTEQEWIIAKQIFEELDKTILKCLHNKPIQFNNSQFKKEYEQIKLRYTGK